ncbi:GNAT family N-acetyltransferase [Phytohabitans rumicis]|uniref:GNAT family N-acetyltransferase n=1 Tax=Phytohabitans rumicis TaxID=1076125 RepID=UPI001FE3501B|nr:GNAT family N-acetyltransferase [Phytohabitans rumicis]
MVELRPATPADSEFCFALRQVALRPYVEATWGWDEAAQRGFHERRFDPAATQIVTVDGRDVGRLVVERGPDETVLGLIELLPAYQGRGIGTALIRDLIAEGRPVALEVLAVNRKAYALYERLGFRETGRDETKVHMRIEVYG